MPQLSGNNVARVRPRRCRVRIVIGPHKSVLAEIFHQAPARGIAEKGSVYLLRDVFAGQLLHVGHVYSAFEADVIFIPLVNVKRNPADFVLDVDELELREARGDIAEDEIEERVGSIGELGIDRRLEDIESLALKAAV